MKILVVSQYYYPEQFNINNICETLVKQGYDITVLTGLPNYPSGKIPQEYRSFRKRREIINGVKVIRAMEFGRKPGLLGLSMNYLSFMISASIKAISIKKDYDLIFVYQLSPITLALPGVLLKKITKKPLYLYCLDIWPESAKNLIKNSNSVVFKTIDLFSKYIYHQCDRISVTTDSFINYFVDNHQIPENRLSVLSQQGFDEYLSMTFAPENEITQFMFMGNVGIAQDMDTIVKAVQLLSGRAKFMVNIVGDGSFLPQVKMNVEKMKLQRYFTFHGRQELKDLPYFYKMADACLLTLDGSSLIGETIPSKLQGYMSAGKPVLAAINGAAQRIIKESHCGYAVNGGDFKGLSLLMLDFIENPIKYSLAGENGRRYYSLHFSEEIFIKNLQNNMLLLSGDINH